MLTQICPGYCNYQSERMNMKVDEDNGKDVGMENGRYRKVSIFSSNEFWKNIGCLISVLAFGIEGSRM